jgi:hypothetical protein
LVVAPRDAGETLDVMRVFEMYIVLGGGSAFGILGRSPHSPRITIGPLVVARESWRFEPAELPWLSVEAAERFIAVRRWARNLGLPRFVFLRSPRETKPCFIDFDSPVFVEILVKLARGASAITLSEMLPTPDQLWLPDAEGNLYTSELRMAAVDPRRWDPEQARP